jgi:hypothetical protein
MTSGSCHGAITPSGPVKTRWSRAPSAWVFGAVGEAASAEQRVTQVSDAPDARHVHKEDGCSAVLNDPRETLLQSVYHCGGNVDRA